MSGIRIEVMQTWLQLSLNAWHELRLLVTHDSHATNGVLIPANGLYSPNCETDTDLFFQDVLLQPGDSAFISLKVRFLRAEGRNLSEFALQVNPLNRSDAANQIVPLPDHPFQVIPSIDDLLQVQVVEICRYDTARKLEVKVENVGVHPLQNLLLTFQPKENIISGPCQRREPKLLSKQPVTFEMVLTHDQLAVELAIEYEGHQLLVWKQLKIEQPAQGALTEQRLFTFLEPKSLTVDRVMMKDLARKDDLLSQSGIFSVKGGQAKYELTIYPSHAQAREVKLYSTPGLVEVVTIRRTDKSWTFSVTILANPLLTQLVRLDYDVEKPGIPQQGEIYLMVRPKNIKMIGFALTAGAAITARGIFAVVPLFSRSDFGIEGLATFFSELMDRQLTELFQLLAVPIVYLAVWFVDLVWKEIQEA